MQSFNHLLNKIFPQGTQIILKSSLLRFTGAWIFNNDRKIQTLEKRIWRTQEIPLSNMAVELINDWVNS